MNCTIFKNHRRLLIIGLVGFFAFVALLLRLIPMLTMGHTDILSMVASDDPLYDLRLVELFLANHFQYTWFDPMTNFPYGTSIYWGPMTIYSPALPARSQGRPPVRISSGYVFL